MRASLSETARFRGRGEAERGTGTRPKAHSSRRSRFTGMRRMHEAGNVVRDGLTDMHTPGKTYELKELLARDHSGNFRLRAKLSMQDDPLKDVWTVSPHIQLEQEAIELRLRQWVRA